MSTRLFRQHGRGCAAEASSDEEQSEVVGEAEEAISLFSFSRSATNNATVNTANFNLDISPSRRVMIGTTGIVAASSSGDPGGRSSSTGFTGGISDTRNQLPLLCHFGSARR